MKKKNIIDNTDLQEAIALVEKNFGKGSIMLLGEKTKADVNVISTGSIKIDQALGVGGFPRGRIVEIFGHESSGKTTIALHTVAKCQEAGGKVAFIDAEHAIDPEYAVKLGVKTEELLLSQPDSGEQALEICEILINSKAVDLIVVDSVAALVPRSELEGEIGDAQVGLQARLMSKALRKLSGALNRSEATIIFINQLRDKIGGSMYGPSEITPGGRALKFFSSIRLEIRKSESLKNGTEAYGNKVAVKVVKNKVAPPFKVAVVELIYGEGISYLGEIIDLATEFQLVDKAGSWYSYQGSKLGQGKEAVKKFLLENPAIVQELDQKIKEHLQADNG